MNVFNKLSQPLTPKITGTPSVPAQKQEQEQPWYTPTIEASGPGAG